MDVILDCFAAYHYSQSQEDFERLINEELRVLKDVGEIWMVGDKQHYRGNRSRKSDEEFLDSKNLSYEPIHNDFGRVLGYRIKKTVRVKNPTTH